MMDIPPISLEMMINLPILGWIAYRVWVLSTLIPGIRDKINDQDAEIKKLRDRVHDLANHSFANQGRISLLEDRQKDKT